MAKRDFKLGDTVTYRVRSNTFQGKVRRAHRDGTYTVETQFVLDDKGEVVPGFLGYRYQIYGRDLSAA